MDLKGQTALVVGASRGFGRGVVESLVAKGMIVTAVARTREDLEEVARKTSATIIVADATNEQSN
jgi:NAD(P)-dependent dehydrogenase (short-subunit alcohol dehydrogenase family)